MDKSMSHLFFKEFEVIFIGKGSMLQVSVLSIWNPQFRLVISELGY